MHSFQFLKLSHLIYIRITQPVLTVDMTVTANFHLIPSLVGHQPFPVPIPKDIEQYCHLHNTNSFHV